MSGIYRGPNGSATADALNIDGDKGDITIANSGLEWTINPNVVTTTKLGGDITSAGKALLDDSDATAQRTTLGLGDASTANIGVDVLAYDSNLQAFVDTFTLPTTDATNGFVLTTNGAGTLSLTAPGGIADNDYGDITVGSGATVWTVNDDAITTTKILDDNVTYSKIQNVSTTDKLLGRVSSGAGDIEEITCTSAGRALLDDADAVAQRTTLGLGTFAVTGDGDKGDITVSSNATVFTIDSGVVTNAKLNTDAKFGRLLGIQIITASGTYTPTTGTTSFVMEQCGGGGGGGGADGNGASTTSASASGAGGAYALKRYTNMSQVFTVTIGAGGVGGAAGVNNGTAGGTTTFAASVDGNVVTTGGNGGVAYLGTAGNSGGGASAGGSASGGDINLNGGYSTVRSVLSGLLSSASTSGTAPTFGGGKVVTGANTDGVNGTNYGEGGGGAVVFNTTTDRPGGDGFQGVVIIREYA